MKDGTLALLIIGAAALCDQGVYRITRASLEVEALAKPAVTYASAVEELQECKRSLADPISLLPGVFPGSCRAYRSFVTDYEAAHQVLDAGDAKPF